MQMVGQGNQRVVYSWPSSYVIDITTFAYDHGSEEYCSTRHPVHNAIRYGAARWPPECSYWAWRSCGACCAPLLGLGEGGQESRTVAGFPDSGGGQGATCLQWAFGWGHALSGWQT